MKKIIFTFFIILFAANNLKAQIVINENFDASATLPTGWVQAGGFNSTTTTPCQGVRSLRKNLYSPNNLTASLTSPNYPAASNGTNVTISFDWKATEWSAGDGVGISALIDYSLDDGTTWVNASSLSANTITQCATVTTVVLASAVPTSSNFKFRISSTWTAGDCYFWVDNISINQVVSTPPVCAAAPVSTLSQTCGNFPVLLSWDAVAGVIGYKVRVGTTPGGIDLVNDVNVSALNYNFTTPLVNTTYYWRVTPYNSAGDAVNCSNNSFTTFTTGCYCVPAPTSVDGTGITNVTLGTINNTTAAEAGNYGDFSAQIATVQQSVVVPVSITYSTGYTYDTRIWVDWNNDFDFNDVGEEVYSEISLNPNPTTLAASFTVPLTQPLGNYRLRIGGTDDTGVINPCYTGVYGSFEDYTIAVIAAPACTAPLTLAATVTSGTTATLSWNANGVSNAEVVIQAPGTGVPAVADNTGVNVAAATYNAMGLTAATAYEYYVRNECTIGSVFSTWSGPFTFNTTQAPTVPTLNTPVNNYVANVSQLFTFSWTPGVGGDPATSYDLFSGNTAATVTDLVGNYTTTSTQLQLNTYATTVYWKIVAKNVGGNSLDSEVRAVSTGPVPGTFCLNAPFGQYPSATYTPAICDDATANSITTAGYGGEFSLMNTEAGRTYTFSSSIATDLITISVDGVNPVANGTGSISWAAPSTGTVRFYTHGDAVACAAPSVSRTRSVICSATLSTNQFSQKGFALYPNPVQDILNVSHTQKLKSIVVTNLLGQEVITKNLNENSTEINTSNLPKGTYLVKITDEVASKTIKIIKE